MEDRTPVKPAKTEYTDRDPTASIPTGTIRGRVVWNGPIPVFEPIRGLIPDGNTLKWGERPNPHSLKIDGSNGVTGVVVYMDSCDPKLAKPWPYESPRVEQQNHELTVRQGSHTGPVGFIRVGEAFEIASHDPEYAMIRARGAGFFTLPFPTPNRPQKRSVDLVGFTEFTSAAGDFWASAEIVSCVHPYYTITDESGKFILTGVPAGEFAVVARLRNGKLLSSERDPETGRLMRLNFDAPFETQKNVIVGEGETKTIQLTLPK